MSTVPLIRTSERADFKRCQQRWWWSWRDGLAPMNTGKALWFGQGIHLALAHHYSGPGLKRGRSPMKVWRDFVSDEDVRIRTSDDQLGAEQYVDAKELGESMLSGYFEEYGNDDTWWVIAPEQEMQIRIPTLDGGSDLAIYCGTYDLVYRDMAAGDKLWLGEHKTAAAIFTQHLPLDDQAGAYWAFATQVLRSKELIGGTERLQGIMYNFLRKAKSDDRPRDADGMALNKDGSVSKRQPTPRYRREPVYRTARERQTQVKRVQSEAAQMDAVRRGGLPILKTPTKDCSWGCGFFAMCQLHEQQADWQEFRDATMIVRDPYADHRKSTEG